MQNRHYMLHTVTIVNLVVIVPSTTCSPMASRFSLSSHTTPLHRSQCKPTRPCNLEKHSSMIFVWCQIEETLSCLHKTLNFWRHRFFFSNEFLNWSGIAQGNLRKKTWVQKSFCEAFLPKGIWFSTNQGWIRALSFSFALPCSEKHLYIAPCLPLQHPSVPAHPRMERHCRRCKCKQERSQFGNWKTQAF